MPHHLELERNALLERLQVLEREHEALQSRPQDLHAHETHLETLRDYLAEVRAYRERLTSAPRDERNLPDTT
jgi:prefoldin subunit 5